MKLLTLAALFATVALAVEPVPMKIFIEPQEGFESYISAAIVKKETPVVVTTNRDDAVYVLTSGIKGTHRKHRLQDRTLRLRLLCRDQRNADRDRAAHQ